MGEQESRVDNIERLAGRRLSDVRGLEVDVRHADLSRLGARDLELGLVDIDPNCLSIGSYAPREFKRCITAAASNVGARQTIAKFEAIEERGGRRVHHAREHAKALSPLNTSANDVVSGIGHGGLWIENNFTSSGPRQGTVPR